ncbi:SRPBCC family protein [Arenibacter latericius]|uniref:SRPBCC family protein n=1 Tax=Arenibacter latericius TaxID=86104 RepID=UPI0003FEDB66|nr:SRPBCC family protein [Arenibacter latericius]MDX1365175.1 SRPBCC family protein [Arenibacter latericius]
MRLYQLHSRQTLPITKERAWKFLIDPNNLKVITPNAMGFNILSGGDVPMFPGQIIQYTVSPFPGYTTKWVTEITHIREGEYFVDEQRFGPYSLWHHKHFITEVTGGVEMEDIIDYKLPFGFLGQIVHPILVKRQLQKIFDYRREKLNTLFGECQNNTPFLEFKSF